LWLTKARPRVALTAGLCAVRAPAIPALTPVGRRAKVLVALRVLPDEWRDHDEKAEYGILQARQLLIEFIGGEPGAQLRDQFA